MADRHTAEDWVALADALQKIVDNPRESRSRREKAQGILDRVGRAHIAQARVEALRKRTEQAWTDADYNGDII